MGIACTSGELSGQQAPTTPRIFPYQADTNLVGIITCYSLMVYWENLII